MAIRRGPVPADAFTIISNAWLRDPRLSLKAKGLAAYIASHAPGHVLTVEQILAENTDGKDAVRAGMAELEAAGYLTREQVRAEGGRISRTDYVLRDPADGGFASAGKSAPGADQAEQDVSAGGSQSGFSGAGEPAGKKTIFKKTKKTPSASQRGTRLADDWMPSESTKAWCAEKLPPMLYNRAGLELAKFRNYWTSKTGAGATKLNWDRTFQNWMLNAADRYGTAPTSGAPAGAQFKSAQVQNQELADRKRLRAKITQAYIEQGLSVDEAYDRAGEDLARLEAGEALETSSLGGYIDGVIIDGGQQEVTSK
jgi:hypothetical protein